MNTERLLEFPCRFPIKAIGLADADFRDRVAAIVAGHAADFDQQAVTVAPSRNGKYVSVTVVIEATSQAQLDAIYKELSACEQVMMAL
ncbi:MAG: YbeD family protein [Gammaproteobacteria bacterium]